MSKPRRLPTFVLVALLCLVACAAVLWTHVEPVEAIPTEEGTCQDPLVCSPGCPCDVECIDRWGETTTCGDAGAVCVSAPPQQDPPPPPPGETCGAPGQSCIEGGECCSGVCDLGEFMLVGTCTG